MNALVHRFVRTASGPMLWFGLGVVVAAKVLVPLVGFGFATISTQLTPIDTAQVVELTNRERAAAGATALVRDAKLDVAAQAKLNDMAAQGYFAHVSPDNLQPWDFVLKAGYRYSTAGENLAKGFKDSTSLVQAWMNSTSHRANIVNPAYRNIGVAVGSVVIEGRQSLVVVQMFATPTPSAAPKPVVRKAPSPSVQLISTDARIAGAELTEVAPPAAESGKNASATASAMAGAYVSAVLVLLSLAFVVTGPRKHALIAWAGHAFALLLLTVVPALGMPVALIF